MARFVGKRRPARAWNIRNKSGTKKDRAIFVFKQIRLRMTQLGIVLRDFLRAVSFTIARRARRDKLEKFLQMRAPDDFFRFSRAEFNVSQNQSEIMAFLEYAAAEKPVTVCEIGVADGGNSFLLSQAIPTASFFVGIDLYVRNRLQLRFFSRYRDAFFLFNSSSTNRNTLETIRRKFDGRRFDLVFIDGNHHYDAVRDDFLTYKEMVREDGLIAFHDIVPDRSEKLDPTWERCSDSVPELWEKLKAVYPSKEFVESWSQTGCGIGVLRYSAKITLPDLNRPSSGG